MSHGWSAEGPGLEHRLLLTFTLPLSDLMEPANGGGSHTHTPATVNTCAEDDKSWDQDGWDLTSSTLSTRRRRVEGCERFGTAVNIYRSCAWVSARERAHDALEAERLRLE